MDEVGRQLQTDLQSYTNDTVMPLGKPRAGIWLQPVMNFRTSFTANSESGISVKRKNEIKTLNIVNPFTTGSELPFSPSELIEIYHIWRNSHYPTHPFSLWMVSGICIVYSGVKGFIGQFYLVDQR